VTAYEALCDRFRRLSAIGGALAVLEWDRSAMMPDGGADARAEQIATLSVIRHELLAAPQVADWLNEAERSGAAAGDWDGANLREMRRHWRHATALPADLVDARSRATATCEMVWRAARRDDDFAAFAPSFAEVLRLTREVAAAKAEAFGLSPYDALVEEYEPGGRAAAFEPVFDELLTFLPAIRQAALERQATRPAPALPPGPFATAIQRDLGLRFMTALGFEFRHGRLDVSLHPFTGGVPEDVRLTTRYREDDFTGALMGVLHETGHALYERGLPAGWLHQPVGEARGMIAHESQSLLIEMQVCRGRDFLSWAVPLMREAFGGTGAAWSLDNMAGLYARVRPGLIRVDADEVCYPSHVILRYRLERALLSGDLAIADLPGAWRDGMKALLDVDVPTDRDGCLQDIHWPSGSFGYFPTYTLGALAAAQLYAAARTQEPAIPGAIASGNFQPLLSWLRVRVHGLGSRLTFDELMRAATGAPLSAGAFRAHLEQRYLA
jgi:carboxypeptidase Taq